MCQETTRDASAKPCSMLASSATIARPQRAGVDHARCPTRRRNWLSCGSHVLRPEGLPKIESLRHSVTRSAGVVPVALRAAPVSVEETLLDGSMSYRVIASDERFERPARGAAGRDPNAASMGRVMLL